MTPGQRRWLEKLRREGPQRRSRHAGAPPVVCKRNGWTKGQWVDAETLIPLTVPQVIDRKFKGVFVIESITDAGRKMLTADVPPITNPASVEG